MNFEDLKRRLKQKNNKKIVLKEKQNKKFIMTELRNKYNWLNDEEFLNLIPNIINKENIISIINKKY